MWTIIWISLCWLALSVLLAWVWHRLLTVEYRMKHTRNERDEQERIREQLAAAFSKNDPPEASPEDRSKRSQIIGDIAEELVFGNGKEE